ncbi:hypothetical protein KJ359_007680 [Pestalotiopsis sp. 9143b]|nr:hypothetical protein KJ359_007680 [Pestalotiopsis sp. 9143b]
MDVVRFLLDDRGADLDVQDNDGCSALRVAFLPMPFENPEMGMLLYERGADHKLLPLAVVVRTSGIDCLKVFLDEKTTNINQSGPDQLTALHEAAASNMGHRFIKRVFQGQLNVSSRF